MRITWDYVARRMKTMHTAHELRLRLVSLKRTYGKSIRGFLPCFFAGLHPRRLLTASGLPHPSSLISQTPLRPYYLATPPGCLVSERGVVDVSTASAAGACKRRVAGGDDARG